MTTLVDNLASERIGGGSFIAAFAIGAVLAVAALALLI
jgi:hypothetical protein